MVNGEKLGTCSEPGHSIPGSPHYGLHAKSVECAFWREQEGYAADQVRQAEEMWQKRCDEAARVAYESRDAEVEELRQERDVIKKKYATLVFTIDGNFECLSTCDSYGHDEKCPNMEAAEKILLLAERAERAERALREILEKSGDDPDVESWKWLARWMKNVAERALAQAKSSESHGKPKSIATVLKENKLSVPSDSKSDVDEFNL